MPGCEVFTLLSSNRSIAICVWSLHYFQSNFDAPLKKMDLKIVFIIVVAIVSAYRMEVNNDDDDFAVILCKKFNFSRDVLFKFTTMPHMIDKVCCLWQKLASLVRIDCALVIDLVLFGRAFEIKLVLCNARYELNHGVITDKYDSIWKLRWFHSKSAAKLK